MLTDSIDTNLFQLTEEEKQHISNPDQIELEFLKKRHCFTIEASEVLHNGSLINIFKNPRFVNVPEHKHGYIEMIYVYKGNLKQIVNDKCITLKEGDIFILNQNICHEIVAAGVDDISLNIMIKPEYFDYLFSLLEKDNVISQFLLFSMYNGYKNGSYLYFNTEADPKVQRFMHTIITEFYENSLLSEQKIKLYLGLLIIELLHNTDKIISYTEGNSDSQRLISILNCIDEHYINLTLDSLSAQTQLSSNIINKLLKTNTGMTFKELVKEKKLDKAAKLLKLTTISLEDVIFNVGYENASHFYKIFKEKYGLSLKEYRDKYSYFIT